MRIGIFGGSFDPIHYGHLILAECCRVQAKLDQVWFVPTSVGPHKKSGLHASDRQRWEMLELALAGNTEFVLSKLELDRGGISYTVDTLTEIKNTHPDDELFFMIGSDSLDQFPTWREPEKILELATPLIVNRPKSESDTQVEVDFSKLAPMVSEARLAEFKSHVILSPLIQISSTEIRRRATENESFRYLLPRAVEKYIQVKKVYQS